MHNANVAVTRRDDGAVVRRPILMQLIDALAVRSVQPSAYDEESTMSPAQLLNRWDGIITEASQRFHVPKAWIRAVMARESGGRTMLGEGKPIVSRAGAVGLMQVLPDTYDQMAVEHRLGANPFDARDNIMAGAAYLRWLHQKYGYPAMFAAYNAGPGKLEDHLEHGVRLPAETRAYVGGITRTPAWRQERAGSGQVHPPRRRDGEDRSRPGHRHPRAPAGRIWRQRQVGADPGPQQGAGHLRGCHHRPGGDPGDGRR